MNILNIYLIEFKKFKSLIKMSNPTQNIQNQNQQSSLKSIIESIVIIGTSLFFIGASFYSHNFSGDLYSDYIIFGYSLVLLTLVVLHSASEKIFSNFLKKNFGLISSLRGKGIVILGISLLYIRVHYTLQKISVIALLIVGIYLIIIDWLVPSTQSKLPKQIVTQQTKSEGESTNTSALDKSAEEKSKSKDNPYNIPDDF